jgi:hypothetical protein
MPWSRSVLLTIAILALPVLSMAQVSLNISVNVPPPELPVYDQPPIPGDGYVWTPGYWAWGDDIQDYYWVPGTWVEAPQPEYLWTPGYWGAGDGAVFLWHAGYWGPHVGFYGGVNYGYGYGGEGYEGGYWQGGHLYYNRSVNNISNVHITNVYNRTVVNNITVNRVSYNGGNGGVRAQPTAADQRAGQERHIAVTPVQREHQQAARGNPVLRAKENNGRPPIAATAKPGAFSGAGVVAARPAGATNPTARGDRRQVETPRAAQPAQHAPAVPQAAAHPVTPQPSPAAHPAAAPRPAGEPRQTSTPRPAVEQPPHPAQQPPHPAQAPPAPRPPPQPKPAQPPREVPHPADPRQEDHEHH